MTFMRALQFNLVERGALLFRISAANRRDRYLWLGGALAIAALILLDAWQRHRPPNWPLLLLTAIYGSMFFSQRRVSIYENGIHLPADSSGLRGRFIGWSQVERFHWDGDILTIVPTSSIMAGAELGLPLLGGVVRVPANRRSKIEKLLAGPHTA